MIFPVFTSQESADGHNITRVQKCNACSKKVGEPDNILLITKEFFLKKFYPYFKVQIHIDNYFKIIVSFL